MVPEEGGVYPILSQRGVMRVFPALIGLAISLFSTPSFGQNTPSPMAQATGARLLTSLNPGDTSGFPESTAWSESERTNCVVYLQLKDGGPIYLLNKRGAYYGALPWVGARAPATLPGNIPGGRPAPTTVRGVSPYPDRDELPVVAFEVPQLPVGEYLVWVEDGPAGAPRHPLRIEPRLHAIASADRPFPDDEFDVVVQIVGPPSPPPTKGSLAARLSMARKNQLVETLKGSLVFTPKPVVLYKATSKSLFPLLAPPPDGIQFDKNPIALPAQVQATVSLVGFNPSIVNPTRASTGPITIKGRERLRTTFATTPETREATTNIRFEAPGFLPAIVTIDKILRPPPPPPPPGKPIPIVFVPGTAGSFLAYSDGEPLWLTDHNLDRHNLQSTTAFARADLDTQGGGGTPVVARKALGSLGISIGAADYWGSLGGALQPYIVQDVYAEFLAWADRRFVSREGRKLFYEAPYDWRKAASLDNARLIDAVVERARREHGADQVILVAHSLGGIVSRDYVRRLGLPGSGLAGTASKVAGIIAVGTPWLGAPKTARALIWGYNFDVGESEWIGGLGDIRTLPDPNNDDATFRVAAKSTANALRHPGRYSMLDLARCKALAKNWPAVWQQLPTPELHTFYREALSGRTTLNRMADFTSIYGWTQDEFDQYLKSVNATLDTQTRAWRSSMFGPFDFGVPHYLIAGLVSPDATGVGDWTDMQMGRPEHLPLPLRAAPRPALLSADYLFEMWTDTYFATDTGKHWGDGTSPLLSATAGAYRDASTTTPNLARARGLLGPNTEIRTIGLQNFWNKGEEHFISHASMLNDPNVRGLVWARVGEIYRAKNVPQLAGQNATVVRSLKIEVKTKPNARFWHDNGTIHIVHAQFRGLIFPINELGNGSGFGLGGGETLSIEVKDAVIKDERGWWRRPVTTDFEGHTIDLHMPGFDNWVAASVRFFADGKVVLNDTKGFTLTGDNRYRTIPMTSP